MYRQIAEDLRVQIESGRLARGSQLPTELELRERHNAGAVRLIRAGNIAQGTVEYLRDTLQIEQVGYRDWLTVRAPNATEADFFRLPQDGRVPVFEIFRTAFGQNGAPMRLTVTIYAADRNQFIFNNGRLPAPQYELGGDGQDSALAR
jgi:DNA-binding GntR family transcriptional regulator